MDWREEGSPAQVHLVPLEFTLIDFCDVYISMLHSIQVRISPSKQNVLFAAMKAL